MGILGPPIHNMGPCSRPGEDPNAWKQFGPEPTRAIEPGSLSVQFAQIAAMSVPVKAERASLAPDVVRALTAKVVTPDVHRVLPVGVVQSVSSHRMQVCH